MRTPACGFCGLPARPSGARPAGAPAARMDTEVPRCAECASLEPDRPGAALRAAGRVLGVDEQDPHLHAALSEDEAAFDGLLYADPHDPLRGRRAPQTEPWAHVPSATRAALARALARSHELRGAKPAPDGPSRPPSGPPGCLLCGDGLAAKWRRVVTSALTPGPGLVEGHLCEACAAAHDRVGAMGPPLVKQAFRQARVLDEAGLLGVSGLRAWVATGLPPGEPWAWIETREPAQDPVAALQAELAELRRQVAALEGRLP